MTKMMARMEMDYDFEKLENWLANFFNIRSDFFKIL